MQDFFGEPFALASYRLFGIFYSGLLRYAEVYPSLLPFTEGSSIGMLTDLFNTPHRSPPLEVARVWLGAWETSNPTLFAGAAWADFGMLGVFFYSLFVGLYLSFINILARQMRSAPVRAAFEAVIGLNSVMLVQIALPPAFLTHGLMLIPFFFWAADRISRFEKVSLGFGRTTPANYER